ncbi:MAG: response regulator [Endozoicomonas sp. (ex Botrylloides leachii)]|nr:response regulator [Endozoicomonas sp. (ex Botrylloides leachii)]
MTEQKDLVSLSWVKEEVEQALVEIRQDLDIYLDKPVESTQLIFCHARFHQVQGSLNIVPQKGASLLIGELLAVTDALIKEEVTNGQLATETLIQGTLQLQAYIENLVRTGSDQPSTMLDLLNRLRNLRYCQPLNNLDFFYPEYGDSLQPLSQQQLDHLVESGVIRLIRKIRKKYQVCLTSYLRNQEPEQSLSLMRKLFGKLQNLCWGSPSSSLWESSAALIEGLIERSIMPSESSNYLLKALDSQLKLLVESNGLEINQTPSEPLLKKVLFLIATAKTENRLLLTQKQRYNLDEALPEELDDDPHITESATDNKKPSITDSEITTKAFMLDGIHKIAVLEAKAEVLEVSHAIGDYVTSQWNKAYLSKIPTLLNSAYDTLNMPPLTEGAKVIKRLSSYIESTWMGEDQQPVQPHITIVQKTLEIMEFYFNQLTQGDLSSSGTFLVQAEQAIEELTKKPASFEPPSLSGITAEQLMVVPTPEREVHSAISLVEQEFPVESIPEKVSVIEPQLTELEEPQHQVEMLASDDVSDQETKTKESAQVAAFLSTAKSVQEELHTKFSIWQSNPQHIESAKVIRRSFNTLKNSARASGANVIGELAFAVENMLNRLLKGAIKVGSSMIDLLQDVLDMLPALTNDFANDSQLLTPEVLLSMEQADDLARGDGFFELDDIENAGAYDQTAEETKTNSTVESQQGSPLELLLATNIETLLSVDQFLTKWLTAIAMQELTCLEKELATLSTRAQAANIEALTLLCNVLIDVCKYLKQHEESLPELLFIPLQEGFETLVDLMNQAAAKQIITPPQTIFAQVKQALEALLRNKHSTKNTYATQASEPIFEEIVLEAPKEQIKDFVKPQKKKRSPPEDQASELNLVKLFLEEAADLTENCSCALESWLRYDKSLRPVAELQRNLHTLKGGARMAEFHQLSNLSHALESVYEVIATGQRESSEAPLGLLKQSHDAIDAMLQAINQDRPEPSVDDLIIQLDKWHNANDIKTELPDYLGSSRKSVATGQINIDIEGKNVQLKRESFCPIDNSNQSNKGIQPKTNSAKINVSDQPPLALQDERIRITSDLIEQLVNLTDESGIHRSQIEQQLVDITSSLNEMERTTLRLHEQLRRLDIETQTQILSKYESEADDNSEFDPLEMDKYSELSQLSNALMESAFDLMDLRKSLHEKSRATEGLLLQQSKTQSQLQSQLLQVRLVPFSRLLPRLQKTVQQLSNELSKTVELKVKNSEVKIDLITLDKIQAPIEHILRNAIVHGIESDQSARLNAEKPAAGQLSMILSCEGSYITLDIRDDGKGVNFAAIREKAIEKDLISNQTEPDENALLHLIMTAGFSTENKVTQFSGRGVGLDVVSNEVRKLGGSIQVESKKNQGTRFVLRLPFRSTVNRALMIEESGYFYAIPMQSIDRLIMADPDELIASYAEGIPIEHGGIKHRLISFGKLLGLTPTRIQTERCPVIIIQRGGENVALHVDTLHGGREIITKSLGPQFKDLTGVNGATILGEGRVVIVIDPVEMIRKHYSRLVDKQADDHLLPEVIQARDVPRILIVDDSITMRKVTTQLLSRHGFHVDSARNGAEAMTLISEKQPDLIVLDVEMPEMDGFEVANAIRNDPELFALPIIMITSRIGLKHRNRALKLGVNQYIGKPFQESILLRTINQLISEAKADN